MRIYEGLGLTESIFTIIIFMMQDVSHSHVHVISPNGKETAHRCTHKSCARVLFIKWRIYLCGKAFLSIFEFQIDFYLQNKCVRN